MTLISGSAPAKPAAGPGKADPASTDGGAGFAAELALASGGGEGTATGTPTGEPATAEAAALPGTVAGLFPDAALAQAFAGATAVAPPEEEATAGDAVSDGAPALLVAAASATSTPTLTGIDTAPTATAPGTAAAIAADTIAARLQAEMATTAVATPPSGDVALDAGAVAGATGTPAAAVAPLAASAPGAVPALAPAPDAQGTPSAAAPAPSGQPLPAGPTSAATSATPAAPLSTPASASPAAGPDAAAPQPHAEQAGFAATVAPEVLETAAKVRVVGPRQGSTAEAPATAPQAVPVPDAASPIAQTVRAEAPAAAAAPRAAATPLNEQLAKPLFTLRTAPTGDHVMTLQVTPENVGPVTVSAHVGVEGVRIELIAPNEQAREALRGILPDLKRDLSSGGMTASLDLSPDDQPTAGGGREPAPERRNPFDDRSPFRPAAAPATPAAAASRTAADPSSRLDVVV